MILSITLSPQLEEFVLRKVESGQFSSPDEVIGQALRLMLQEEELHDAKFEQLRQAIREGAEGGPAVEWELDEFKISAHKRLAAKANGGD